MTFIWLPILFLPHVVLPGALLYMLYVAANEDTSDTKDISITKRHRRHRKHQLPPKAERLRTSPLHMFTVCNELQLQEASANLWKVNAQKSPMYKLSQNNRFYIQLFSAVLERQMDSPMYKLSQNTAFRKRLTEPKLHKEYSPMKSYIRDSNVGIILAAHYLIRRNNTYHLRTIDTELKKELTTAHTAYKRRRAVVRMYKADIVPHISSQRRYVLSPLKKILCSTCKYAEHLYIERQQRYNAMALSVMRQYITSYDICDKLESMYWLREYDMYLMARSPMRLYVCNNKEEINSLSRRYALHFEIGLSPLHKCIKQAKPLLDVLYQYSLNRRNNMQQSLLRKYILCNTAELIRRLDERLHRAEIRQNIVNQLHAMQYTFVYNKMLLRRYRDEHQIPAVHIDGTYNTVYILFPYNTMKNNQFIADTHLQCFEPKEDYYSATDAQSYCTTHISDEAQMNDLVELSQTFKNLSSLTDAEANVWLLTDRNKLTIQGDALSATHYIRISFVRRDREAFDISQYKSCCAVVNDYLAEKTIPGMSIDLVFENKWLTDEIVIVVEAPVVKDQHLVKNAVEDVVQRINMIRGLIFAKIVDQIRWISL